MKILIIHQVPYRKLDYPAAIDHDAHQVTYLGQPASLDQIPAQLRHERVVVDGDDLDDDRRFGEAALNALNAAGLAEVDSVVSMSEFGLYAGAWARGRFGLPHRSDASIDRVRDKVAMKRRLSVAGIAVPRFVADAEAARAAAWTGPTIAKPRRGAGSSGVLRFDSLAQALAATVAEPEPEPYEYEEFVTGDVLHVDGYVQDGGLRGAIAAECVGTPLEYAGGAVIGSVQIDDPEVVSFAERAVRALGLTEGAVHLELFRCEPAEAGRRLVFLEIGNRVGGAGIITAYARRTGLDLAAREIRSQAGLPQPAPGSGSGRFHGFVLAGADLPATALGYAREQIEPHADTVYLNEPTDKGTGTYHEWEVPLFVEVSDIDPDRLKQKVIHYCDQLNALRVGSESVLV
jgi:biotin carboxylase